MEHNNEPRGFQYTYSAAEQSEVKRIREKYMQRAPEENKMERLRRLDNAVTQKAQAVSLIFGVIGTLILGFGMSLFMSELGTALGMSETLALVLGILIGIPGGGLACLAYPAYQWIIKRERERIAPEILRLTDELMK